MCKIVMNPVKSSTINSVGFNPDKDTLTVQFNNGGLYRYSAVTPFDFVSFMCAESKGKFLNESIKPHHDVKQINEVGGK